MSIIPHNCIRVEFPNVHDPIHLVNYSDIDSVKIAFDCAGIQYHSIEYFHMPNIHSWGNFYFLKEAIEHIKTYRPQYTKERKENNMLTSKTNESTKNERSYPKLMKNKQMGFIILATSKEKPDNSCSTSLHYRGMVVVGNEYQKLGFYSQGWDGNGFEDYVGEVTLKQE